MKYLKEVPRVLLGLLLLGSGLAGLLMTMPAQELQGGAAAFMTGLSGTYLFILVKITEITTGALLLSNRFVPLALVILAPVTINILGFHAFYDQKGLVVPILMVAAQVFIAWQHRATFAVLLSPKPSPSPLAGRGPG